MSIIILLTVVIHQVIIYLITKRFDVFGVYTLIDVVILSMFFLGCNADAYLSQLINTNISFFATIYVGLIGLYLGLHFLPFYRIKTKKFYGKSPTLTTLNQLLPILFFGLSIVAIVYQGMKSSGLGVMDYLVKGRMIEYLASVGDKEQGGAFWFVLVSGFRPILLYLMCFYLDEKRWLKGVFIYLILLLGILCIFNTRLEVVITLALPVAYWHYNVRRIRLGILVFAIPLFFILMSVLDTWRNEGVENFSNIDIGTERRSEGFSRDINAVRGFQQLWELNEEGLLEKEYGANYLYMLLTPIPRFIWDEKPILAFEPRWTSLVIKDFSEGVWIFTAWGEGLAQFGFFGVFLNLFLYGIVVKSFMSFFGERRKFHVLIWFYYVLLAATFLRGGFQALFIMSLFYFIPVYFYLIVVEKRLRFN